MDPHLINIMNEKEFGDPELRYNLEKMDIYSIGCTFLKLAKKWNSNLYNMYYY